MFWFFLSSGLGASKSPLIGRSVGRSVKKSVKKVSKTVKNMSKTIKKEVSMLPRSMQVYRSSSPTYDKHFCPWKLP